MEEVGSGFGNKTSASTTSFKLVTEQIGLKAEFKPIEFMPDGNYELKKFGFVVSNNSEICPLNNCKYTVEEGKLSPNFGSGYIFEGRLKVTTVEQDVKKSKYIDFSINMDKIAEEERNGKTLQILDGQLGLGGTTRYDREILYDMTNATLQVNLKNPILTINGERGRLLPN